MAINKDMKNRARTLIDTDVSSKNLNSITLCVKGGREKSCKTEWNLNRTIEFLTLPVFYNQFP